MSSKLNNDPANVDPVQTFRISNGEVKPKVSYPRSLEVTNTYKFVIRINHNTTYLSKFTQAKFNKCKTERFLLKPILMTTEMIQHRTTKSDKGINPGFLMRKSLIK